MRSIALSLVLLTACSGSEPSQPASTSSDKPSQEAAPREVAAPSAAREGAGGLVWEGKAPLVRRAPKSSMRAAEYGLASDPQAELTVFYFGADQGGSVDANITRWLGQFSQADGSDTASKAVRAEQKVADGAVTVTTIEATGSFGGGMAMPGAPAPSAISDAMLLGAIAQGPQGPVFFKLVGPRASVEGAREAFGALIASLKIDPKLMQP